MKIMNIRNSVFKLGAMAIIVALVFIACKKGKEAEPNSDKSGTATAMIKIDDKAAIKFENIPLADYSKMSEEDRKSKPVATMNSKGNLMMVFLNKLDIDADKEGMGFIFYCHSVAEGKEYQFAQKEEDMEAELDDNGQMVVHKGYTMGFQAPGTNFFESFQTIEVNGNTGSGSLKITSLTKDRVKGTFSSILYDKYGQKAVVSDGKFDLPITQQK